MDEQRLDLNPDLVIYILGAGASKSAGYPLAADFPEMLSKFENYLADDSSQKKMLIKDTVTRTIDQLQKTGTATIDQLAWMVKDRSIVEDAKIASEALFLHIETQLTPRSLREYTHFIVASCLRPGGGSTNERLRGDVRVFTFNYDRLLEIAFALLDSEDFDPTTMMDRALATCSLNDLRNNYHQLNVGFQHGSKFEVKEECFTFLKLHGSVAIRSQDRDSMLRYSFRYQGVAPEVVDSDFWREGKIFRTPSQIVFPHEKASLSLEEPAERLPAFQKYIATAARVAMDAVKRAKTIHICGYSLSEPQWTRFTEIIQAAPRTCLFVVHDTSSLPYKRVEALVYPRKAFHIPEPFGAA